MKLLYTARSLANPGGKERVLVNKITWQKRHTDWEILVVTTDQKGRDLFHPVLEVSSKTFEEHYREVHVMSI